MKNNTQKYLKLSSILVSLSGLLIKDVSATSSLTPNCEIRVSCSQSHGCQYTRQTIVNPDSTVIHNCSVKNDGVAHGTIWRDLRRRLHANNSLALQQLNSTGGNNPCQCTRIQFTRKVVNVFRTNTPVWIYTNEQSAIECSFRGWPRPRVIWKKNGKPIINGSEGFYLSDEPIGEDTLRSVLHLNNADAKHDGAYSCNAENSIPGWSSKSSKNIDLNFHCPPAHPVVNSSKVSAMTSSNISLKCLFNVPQECSGSLKFEWRFNNTLAPLNTGGKYQIVEKWIDICKKESIITISNLTDADEGKYGCHLLCKYLSNNFSVIKLEVYHPLTSNFNWIITGTVIPKRSSNRSWVLPVIIMTSGSVLILIILATHFLINKHCMSSYKAANVTGDLEEGIVSNNLFISFSSKDSVWVNENLIPILEKHSISYSIHTRDFELGIPIVQNMADSVYGSRKVLIVLSDNYLASNFCREELHMAAQREKDSGDSSLVLVVVSKLKIERLPAALKNKGRLDFEKHKMKKDWEKKLLSVTLDDKAS